MNTGISVQGQEKQKRLRGIQHSLARGSRPLPHPTPRGLRATRSNQAGSSLSSVSLGPTCPCLFFNKRTSLTRGGYTAGPPSMASAALWWRVWWNFKSEWNGCPSALPRPTGAHQAIINSPQRAQHRSQSQEAHGSTDQPITHLSGPISINSRHLP